MAKKPAVRSLPAEEPRYSEDLSFKTKPQLAAEMYRGLRAEEILPFKYVVADSIYGVFPARVHETGGGLGV